MAGTEDNCDASLQIKEFLGTCIVHQLLFLASTCVVKRCDVLAGARKFYGTINQNLKEGDELRFMVTHQFNTYGFDGEKELLVTTAGWFGNRNPTFGAAWIITGIVCLIIASTYTALGWHQMWREDVRVNSLQDQWKKGTRHRLDSAMPVFVSSMQGRARTPGDL